MVFSIHVFYWFVCFCYTISNQEDIVVYGDHQQISIIKQQKTPIDSLTHPIFIGGKEYVIHTMPKGNYCLVCLVRKDKANYFVSSID